VDSGLTKVARTREETGWGGAHFGGIAIKYQAPVSDAQAGAVGPTIKRMASLLGVSRPGFYAWLKREPSPRAVGVRQARIEKKICWFHGASDEVTVRRRSSPTSATTVRSSRVRPSRRRGSRRCGGSDLPRIGSSSTQYGRLAVGRNSDCFRRSGNANHRRRFELRLSCGG